MKLKVNGSKTYCASIGAMLMMVGSFMESGVYGATAIIALVQNVMPYIVAICLRHSIK